MNLNIDSKSPLPAYQQVSQSLRLEIVSGRLREGDQLPSIRDLARLLRLNPNTVAKAYYTLEQEGFIAGRSGSGSWVTYKPGRSDALRRAMLEDEFRGFLQKAMALGFGAADIKKIVARFVNHE